MPLAILALAPLSLATILPLVLVLAFVLAIVSVYRTDQSVLLTDVEIRDACGRDAWLPDAPTVALAAEFRHVARACERTAVYMVNTHRGEPWFIHARDEAEAIGIVLVAMDADPRTYGANPARWSVVQMGVMPPLEARVL